MAIKFNNTNGDIDFKTVNGTISFTVFPEAGFAAPSWSKPSTDYIVKWKVLNNSTVTVAAKT